ncbi:MAG: hypothetical protein FRX49_10560 [Trebouxia sp. A1-2]|nr:MAG: hypothetical protein FRX49_10560 [Trebouxia sp. A1-2]
MECFRGCFAEPVLPLKDALLSLEAPRSALGSEGSKVGILEGRDVLAVRKEWLLTEGFENYEPKGSRAQTASKMPEGDLEREGEWGGEGLCGGPYRAVHPPLDLLQTALHLVQPCPGSFSLSPQVVQLQLAGGLKEQLLPHMQKSDNEMGDVAMCNEKNVKYYIDTHRPTRFRALP